MDNLLPPEVRALAPFYLAVAVVLVVWLSLRRSQSPAARSARARFPALFFGALTFLAVLNGIYQTTLCLREFLAAKMTAWGYFFDAELSLLFAWRFFILTRLCLAVRRGVITQERVRLKRGAIERLLFIIAAPIVAILCFLVEAFSARLWWFAHLWRALVAVLIFCAFTYPWKKAAQTGIHPATRTPFRAAASSHFTDDEFRIEGVPNKKGAKLIASRLV